MCRCFVRLEHMWMWALMIMLLHTFVYFGSWWHSGMKRPGLTLHVLAHETCSTLDMQLVLHKWLCGCLCLSHYSYDLIYNGLLIIFLSTLWFLFVGKNGSILESPKPRKICKNKLEASNLFLQGMWCDMVIVTKIVVCNEIYCKLNNRQEPDGCLFLLWPAC